MQVIEYLKMKIGVVIMKDRERTELEDYRITIMEIIAVFTAIALNNSDELKIIRELCAIIKYLDKRRYNDDLLDKWADVEEILESDAINNTQKWLCEKFHMSEDDSLRLMVAMYKRII